MKKTRILLVYESLSTGELGPIEHGLKEKYDDEHLPVYHVHIDGAPVFLEENGEFKFIFFENSIKEEKIKGLHLNGARTVKGVLIKDEGVDKFLNSL